MNELKMRRVFRVSQRMDNVEDFEKFAIQMLRGIVLGSSLSGWCTRRMSSAILKSALAAIYFEFYQGKYEDPKTKFVIDMHYMLDHFCVTLDNFNVGDHKD